jgi:hypothetical protein
MNNDEESLSNTEEEVKQGKYIMFEETKRMPFRPRL